MKGNSSGLLVYGADMLFVVKIAVFQTDSDEDVSEVHEIVKECQQIIDH